MQFDSMYKNIALVLFFFLCHTPYGIAQKTLWASKVISFSSEKVIPFQNSEYKAVQALGKPNILPEYGDSGSAWQPYAVDRDSEDYIMVSFDVAIPIRQVVVAENYGQGCIAKVVAYDTQKQGHLIYQSDKQTIVGKGNFFNIILPEMTDYSVAAIKLIINTSKIKGPNQIDAIGISDLVEPIKASIKVAADAPKTVVRENLGKSINSRHQELTPVISSDGKTLYYTRNYVSIFGKEKDQDIFYSTQNDYGEWEKAKNIGFPINNGGKNNVVAVAANGKEILLLNGYNKENPSQMKGGISKSYKMADGTWSFPEEVKIDNYYNRSVNADYSIAPNGNILVMSIKRDNSIGRRDLYVCFKKPNNTWSAPKHMGNVINSAEHEVSPFIASDSKTLYFSSKGFPGYGDNDIFKTVRLDDTWTNWSEPENLGAAINTSEWDAYFTMPASSEYAYICSVSSFTKKEDIFRLTLPKSAQANPVCLLTGSVLSTTDKKPIACELEMITLDESGKEVKETQQFTPEKGTFTYILPLQKRYEFVPVAKGYLSISNDIIDLTAETRHKEIRQNFYLLPLEVGNKGMLNSLTFQQGDASLQADAFKDLDRIVQAMLEFPTLEIFFEGHTDNQGDFQLNMQLSEDRVKAVKDYLISKGIDANRITTKGWGPTQPIASNASEERRKLNRRVEFTIMKK